MSLMSWLIRSKPAASCLLSEEPDERKALKAELAQQVVTFERKRHNVQRIAEEALQSMREGHRG